MPDVTSASVLEQVQEELIEQQEPSCVACNWNRYPNYNAARLVLDVNGVSHTVHRYCLFSCNICRIEYIKDELLGSVSNSVQSRDICTNCFDEMKEDNLEYDWTTCHGCDTYMREDSDDAIWSDARDKYLCVACYENYIECNNCGYEYYEPDGHECEEENESAPDSSDRRSNAITEEQSRPVSDVQAPDDALHRRTQKSCSSCH